MRIRILLSLCLITAAVGPVSAQTGRGGLVPETTQRLQSEHDPNLLWNLIGLIGLLGLLGLRREHPDDSYHPASLE